MRISDWSSDVCSSDLLFPSRWHIAAESARRDFWVIGVQLAESLIAQDMAGFISARNAQIDLLRAAFYTARRQAPGRTDTRLFRPGSRSEEPTSELQSLMPISFAVFFFKKKNSHTFPP